MPTHTPAERARNAPIRARQRRRNASKAGFKAEKSGNAPKSKLTSAGEAAAGLLGGLRRFIPPFTRTPVTMSAKDAGAIRAPSNSPPMSSFEKPGGINGR